MRTLLATIKSTFLFSAFKSFFNLEANLLEKTFYSFYTFDLEALATDFVGSIPKHGILCFLKN